MHLRSILRWTPVLLLAGCRAGTAGRVAQDTQALPPNTVMLSQMMRELSSEPGFTERLLDRLNQGEKNGAFLTPRLFDLLRSLILGKDWSGLDRFPGWTIQRITQTVDLGQDLLKRDDSRQPKGGLRVQLGPYSLDRVSNISLDTPSDRPPFSTAGLISDLGSGVQRGDGPDPKLAPLHAESQRLAEILNRLSLNGLQLPEASKVAAFSATIQGHTAATPQDLMTALQATGHTVIVGDARYFANFGHFHYRGQDVEMPFWLDTGLLVPPNHFWQRPHRFLIPVAHAEYEWVVNGPLINADVTFYFGIDGRAEFRTNDTLNQPWVMKRWAHEYRGAQAVEVTRLTGSLLRAYAYLHSTHPQLPFGGYYTLGVCQDVVAAIEQRMTGTTTIFPNTARTELFRDQPDPEVFQIMNAIPKDISGTPPAPERIFGSLPTTDFNTITVPGLRADVDSTYAAWQHGSLPHRVHGIGRWLSFAGLAIGAIFVATLMRSRREQA